MDKRNLEIVIRARDQASRVIQDVSKSTRGLTQVFRENFREAGLMAGAVVGALGLATKAAVENAAAYEQNRIAFETMLGSAEMAQKTLKEVSDFAAKTPFDLPQVVTGAKQLLAYNVEAEKLIPTFQMLGDIAAGVGTEKLPNLILAFGQVKAATRLTGMELRQFSEAGVPLLQALTSELNKNRDGMVAVQTGTKKTAEEMAELNYKLNLNRQKLKEATDSGKAKESTMMRLRHEVAKYEGELAQANDTTTVFRKQTKLTEKDVLEMVSKGEISFETVQKALQGMTKEGGKFFNLMDRQSKTFSGIMSNIGDEFGRFVRDVVGISATGDIREGSLFAHLRDGARSFLNVLTEVRPQVVRLVNELIANRNVVLGLAGAMGGLLVLAIGAFVAAFGPAILVMGAFAAAGAGIALLLANFRDAINDVLPYLAALAAGITAVSLATNGLTGSIRILWTVFTAHPIGLLVTALTGLALAMGYVITQTDTFKTKTDLLTEAQDRLKESSDKVTDAQERLKDVYLRLEGAELSLERAQKNLDQAVKTYGESSLEAKEAQHQLNQAQREAERATTAAKDAIQEADAAYGTYKENAKEYQKTVESQETAWGRLRDTIGGAISKLNEWNNKSMQFGVGVGNFLDRFDQGGWVTNTGPAIVHKGEFVLSRDMLAGRQPVPASVPSPSRTVNINLGGVQMRGSADVDALAHRLGFYFQTSGNI